MSRVVLKDLSGDARLDVEQGRTRKTVGEISAYAWVRQNIHLDRAGLELEKIRDTYWSYAGLSEPMDHHCMLKQIAGVRSGHVLAVSWPEHVASPNYAHTQKMRQTNSFLQEQEWKLRGALDKAELEFEAGFVMPVAKYLWRDGIIIWHGTKQTYLISSAQKFAQALELSHKPSGATWNRCGTRIVENFLKAKATYNLERHRHFENMLKITGVGVGLVYSSGAWEHGGGVRTPWRGAAAAQWIAQPPTLPEIPTVELLLRKFAAYLGDDANNV